MSMPRAPARNALAVTTLIDFVCRSCGFVEHADLNASHNIGRRGWWIWVTGARSTAPVLTLTA
ncbi:zinc ribbon domain-containing protein [Streptomyces sp. NPDC048277]|uniref:zinc ribbon domain-containing protein n=1 Tax=Streptomyces sp. NPDC048277 TaxID=3155027 RepID=UPI0033CE366D